jgi:hypothetical protein
VTAAGLHRPSPGAAPARVRARPGRSVTRLAWLYVISRRIPAALGLLIGIAAVLWAALYWRWNIIGGPAARELIPLTLEAAAAAVIAVTTYGPFGETERATGRWLPYLRLSMTVGLTAAAVGALAAAATGGHLPDGTLAMLRNVAGLTGTGLLTAVGFGGAFGWAGPLSYLLITEGALAGSWTTPWMWTTRPPHDLGGALCAALVFVAGAAAVTVRGGQDHGVR